MEQVTEKITKQNWKQELLSRQDLIHEGSTEDRRQTKLRRHVKHVGWYNSQSEPKITST